MVSLVIDATGGTLGSDDPDADDASTGTISRAYRTQRSVDFGALVVVDLPAGVFPALTPLLAVHRAWDRPDPSRV